MANQKNTGLLGPFLVFLSAALFATGGLWFKFIPWHAMAINAARSILAGLFLLTVSLVTHHKFRVTKSVLIAALGICVTNNLFSLANKLTTAGNAIVLQFTMPVYVILLMWLFFKKKPKVLDVTVCAAVLCGVVLFFLDELSPEGLLGNICALVSGFFYALFFIFNNREDSEPVTSTLIAYAASALIGLPWLIRTDFTAAPEGAPLWGVFAAVLALGFVQQGCAQLSFSHGIKRTSAVTAALVSGIEPVLNPVLVAVFQGEMLQPLAIVGGCIVLVSIVAYNALTAKNK